MSEFEGIVGNNRAGIGDGAGDVFRLGKTGELVQGRAHGEFFEPVSRAAVFSACTATGGVAHGTSLSTTASFTLHNPLGSGVILSLLTASMGYLSGTLGLGVLYLTTHAGVAVANPSGTAITIRQNLLGSSSAGKALAFTTATVATQIAIRPVASFGPFLASTVFTPVICKDAINGEISVYPGFGVNLHSVAGGGSTPLVLLAMSWEEIPIPT